MEGPYSKSTPHLPSNGSFYAAVAAQHIMFGGICRLTSAWPLSSPVFNKSVLNLARRTLMKTFFLRALPADRPLCTSAVVVPFHFFCLNPGLRVLRFCGMAQTLTRRPKILLKRTHQRGLRSKPLVRLPDQRSQEELCTDVHLTLQCFAN